MNCAQCGRKFTCGCQKSTTKNGKTVCKGECKKKYELQHKLVHSTSTNGKAVRRNEFINKKQRARRYR